MLPRVCVCVFIHAAWLEDPAIAHDSQLAAFFTLTQSRLGPER